MKSKLMRFTTSALVVLMIMSLTACKKTTETEGEWITEQNYYYYDENGEWTEVSDPSLLDKLAQNAPNIDGEEFEDNNSSGKNSTDKGSEETKKLSVIIDAYEEKDKFMFSSTDISFDSSNSTALGDSVRAIRKDTKKEGIIVYKNDDGIGEFVIQVLHPNEVNASVNPKYFVSKDNVTYTEVKAQDIAYKPVNGNSWSSETIYVGGIDTSNKYLKIVIPTGGPDHWAPNIAHLQINGCDEDALAGLGGYNSKRGYSHSIYVDPKNGNDRNKGTSEKEALKSLYAASQKTYAPGDKILLKSGESFSGSLTIIGSGLAKKPIMVTTYGGEKPACFNGRGGTVVTYYGEYITFDNLEFTNRNGKNAITISALKPGASKGICIKNCNFYDINTKFDSTGYDSGGIYLTANGREPNWFDGVLITDNTFNNVAKTAIYVSSSWSCLDKDQLWGNKNLQTGGWYPNKNVSIKNNTITEGGGDAILLIGAQDSIIERNVAKNCGLFKNTGSRIAWATIWLRDSKDCIVQYNSVYGNRDKNGASDLQAYDSDIGCRNCIFQYNYSQDNAGGFMLLCSGVKDQNAKNDGTIVRYNLSVNDGYDLDSKVSRQVIDIVDNVQNAQIYNNTIYSSKNDVVLVQFADYGEADDPDVVKIPPTNNTLINNIFYVKSGVKNTAFRMWDTQAATASFNNNVFYGVDIPNIVGITTSNNHTNDPNLREPGAQGGTLDAMAEKYKPKSDSYVLKNGVAVNNSVLKDMLGRNIDNKLIGALTK